MLCPSCKEPTSEQYRYCLQCGADIGPVTLVRERQQAPTKRATTHVPSFAGYADEPTSVEEGGSLVTFFGFATAVMASVIIVLLIGLGAYLYYAGGEPELEQQPAAAPVPSRRVVNSRVPTPTPTATPATTPTPLSKLRLSSLPNGLRFFDHALGSGPYPEPGQFVTIHYVASLADGPQFDSTYDRNTPIEFQVGHGQLIRGLEEGLLSMRRGGRRIIVVPPWLGYGAQGSPPNIPPNAHVVYAVELLDIQ